MLDIVGLCGSLRQGSVNRAALRLAGQQMPSTMALEIVEWRDIPAYDDDLKAAGMPSSVAALAERLHRADGIVLATPEYNFSIPGAFKNMIDWISRMPDHPFGLKPVALLSASPGPIGGARMQYDLRKVLLFLNAMPLAKPEIFIGHAFTKFDAEGHCTDETTRKFVGGQMAAFEIWIADVARLRGTVR